MTVGRRGDKTYTGQNGVPTDRLRALDKLANTSAGLHGRVAPPSQEALRAFIASQTCPWCNAGPFKLLATHTRKAHGVTGKELRELAGLIKTASICSPDHSARTAERHKGQRLPDIAYERAKNAKRELSEAAKAVSRAKLAALRANPDWSNPVWGDESRRLAAEASAKKSRALHAAVLDLHHQGHQPADIAEQVDIHPATVRRILQRHSEWTDGRTTRWDCVSKADRAKAVRESQAARAANSAEVAEATLHEWEQTRQTFADLKRLAEARGQEAKVFRQYLVRHGATVPDGRKDR